MITFDTFSVFSAPSLTFCVCRWALLQRWAAGEWLRLRWCTGWFFRKCPADLKAKNKNAQGRALQDGEAKSANLTTNTGLRWLRAAEHVSPSSLQEGGTVAVVEGSQVLSDRMGPWKEWEENWAREHCRNCVKGRDGTASSPRGTTRKRMWLSQSEVLFASWVTKNCRMAPR